MAEKQSPHELEIMTFLIIFVTGGFLFIFWYFFHEQVTEVIRWIRVGEMWIGSLIFGDDLVVNTESSGTQTLGVWKQWLPKADVKAIGVQELLVSTQIALAPLRGILAGILAILGITVALVEPGKRYNRKLKLQDLMEEQAKSFPYLTPFIEFNPLKSSSRVLGGPVPEKLQLFAEALSPEEWVAYNKVPFEKGKLDRKKAYKAFTMQLGARWQGPEKLPIYAQGLYAAFALKSKRKRKDAEDLLGDLACSWSAAEGFQPSSKLIKRIHQIIADPATGGDMRKYTDKHAYNTTALVRALNRARDEGGVLAPAQFLWLRGVDRHMWYALNNLGRKAFHPEAAGSMIHYIYELVSGQKIPTPQVEEAVISIENFVKAPDARPIPPLQAAAPSVKK